MRFPNYFADAEKGFKDSKYVLFGVPYDETGSFRRGTKKAPYEIRQASWNFEPYDLLTGVDLHDVELHDYGDLEIGTGDDPFRMKKEVKGFVHRVLDNKKVPIAMGGEHTITVPIVGAFAEAEKDFVVVALDAHLDFKDVYENNPESHACVIRRLSDILGVENIAILGVRSGTREEFKEGEKSGLLYVNSFEMKQNGVKWAIKRILQRFSGKKIYLTLDVDVIDPAYAPGVSTPEPFGISQFDVLECIKAFASHTVGMDIVEVCPPYDKGETSLLAAKIIRFAIGELWKHNP
ncbi:MAG TPA: agmatinase [Thermoplasmatales archaeon]|nr:agmatinase [Thermoplasmatales archaeon]